MSREETLLKFYNWRVSLQKKGIKLSAKKNYKGELIVYFKGDNIEPSLAEEFNALKNELGIKTDAEFDKFMKKEYVQWVKKRFKVKLNRESYKELLKYYEGSDLDFVQLRKDNRQIVESTNEIHLDLRTNKNKKLKQLENFLERLKTRNVENYVCAYKLYGLDWKNYPLRNPENWE